METADQITQTLKSATRPRSTAHFIAKRLNCILVLGLFLIQGQNWAIAAEQCKAACEVPEMEGCPSCTVACLSGQMALCTPGESVSISADQKKCAKNPTCKCEGQPAKDQANCGMGCGEPVLLGNPCATCSIICPTAQVASCISGKAVDLFIAGKTAKCVRPPRCSCS